MPVTAYQDLIWKHKPSRNLAVKECRTRMSRGTSKTFTLEDEGKTIEYERSGGTHTVRIMHDGKERKYTPFWMDPPRDAGPARPP